MTEARPARPVLATLICIFEVGIVALAIALHFIARYLREVLNQRRANFHYTHPQPIPAFHYTPMHLALLCLSSGLALAVAITLWQMRRSAFYLLATRTALSCVTFAVGLVHSMSIAMPQPQRPMPISPAAVFWIAHVLSLCWLAFTIAMTWYVHDITKPMPEPPSLQA